jgi:hypothetical protein
MDPLRIRAETKGFFTRAETRDIGYDDKAVACLIRTGVWHRFRRGFYTFTDLWTALDDVGRHRVRSHAVLRSLGPSVALSHTSGVVEHDMSTWDLPLDRVHVTRLDGGAGRVEGDVVHHEGLCLDDDVIEVDGHRVLAPERCAIEAASQVTNEVALVLFDSLLNHELSTYDELQARFELMQFWPRTRHLHIPVRMADRAAESPGESRGRWLCWMAGLPQPQLQYKVFDARGVVFARCDWAWPDHGTLGEFDGRVKYGRVLLAGQDPGEVVFAEKQREDQIREITGCRMVRVIWSDYDRPRVTAARIERQLRLAG